MQQVGLRVALLEGGGFIVLFSNFILRGWGWSYPNKQVGTGDELLTGFKVRAASICGDLVPAHPQQPLYSLAIRNAPGFVPCVFSVSYGIN